MIRFSASDAALEGFQMLRTHWRVVAGWALFHLLALVAMIVVTVIVGVGIGLAAGVAQGSGAAAVIGALAGVVVTALIETVLIVGLYRLMLRPGDPGFLHLRLGRDEGRLFVVGVIFFGGIVLFTGLATVLGALAAQAGPAVRIAAGLLALVVGGWLALRFGLVAPLSFAEGRIDFTRSWRLTRGQAWPLFGMWFLNFCLVMFVWLALYLAVFVLSGLLTGFHGFAPADDAEALMTHPARYLIEAIIPILVLPALLVVSQAPWVAAYRALSQPAAEAQA
jgi:hypothetical protein